MWHFGDGMGWGHGGWWGLGMIGMALFWIVVLLAVVWASRMVWGRAGPGQGVNPPTETPLQILQRRYARGEIDKAEYEEKRKDLQ